MTIKKTFIIIFILLTKIVISQENNCDCVVRFGFARVQKKAFSKEVKPLLPKAGNKFAFHEVIKDSATYLTYKPHIFDSVPGTTIRLIKQSLPIMSEILFNGADSIPLYKDPNKDSKVLLYIHKEGNNSKTPPDFRNYTWFLGCKNGFIRIMDKQNGWIRSENYVHFTTNKKG